MYLTSGGRTRTSDEDLVFLGSQSLSELADALRCLPADNLKAHQVRGSCAGSAEMQV